MIPTKFGMLSNIECSGFFCSRLGKIIHSRPQCFGKLINGTGIRAGGGWKISKINNWGRDDYRVLKNMLRLC